MFESLLQELQSNFAGHRALLPELEQLAQTAKQRTVLYRVWAEGLLAAGELSRTFDVLLKLSDPSLGKPELERLDGHRSMRRDQWIRAQLQLLIQKLDEPSRDRIQAELQQRLKGALADKSDEGLRDFIRHFGSHPIADDARQALADRLIAIDYDIESEQLLAMLSRNANPGMAGRALAVMVRELIKAKRGSDCAAFVERLGQDFMDIVCLDNKTGKQLAEEWRAVVQDPGIDWPTGRVETTRESIEMHNPSWGHDITIDGDSGPFFRNSQFRTVQDGSRAIGLNGWGEPQWAIPLGELGQIDNVSTFRAQVRNHVVLLTIGRQVCAISTLTSGNGIRAKTLWNASLTEGSLGNQGPFFQFPVNRPGMIRQPFNRFDFRQAQVGTVGAIEDDTLVILSGRNLILAQLLTGEPLWKRGDIVPGSEILGDAETIVVLPPDKTEGELIRRVDGVTIGTVPVAPSQSRILTYNRSILSAARILTKNALIFQAADVPANKTLWERSFDLNSQFMVISNSELAVLEPTGMLSLVQLSDGQVRWQQKLTLAAIPKDLWVIPNKDRLLVMNGQMPAPNLNRQAVVVGNNPPTIDGQADCLDRATGKPYWTQRIESFGLDYSQPQFLPFWLFTVRTQIIQAQAPKSEFHLMAIDKRNGQVLLKATESSYINSYQVKADADEKQVQVTLFSSPNSFRHTLKFTDQPVDGPAKPPNP